MSTNNADAIIFNGTKKPLEKKNFPLSSEIGDNEVIVEISLTTVCGSDVHTWLGHRPFPTPCILGHEMVGKVIKLGACVKNDFSGNKLNEGDRIVWSMTVCCKECFFCKHNLPQKCTKLFKYGHEKSDVSPFFSGGFAEYIILKESSDIFKIPDELSNEEVSPLMCAGACVLNGLNLAEFADCNHLVVQGCGALGLYACAFGKALGAKKIIAIDRNESRLDFAKEFGADYTILVNNNSESIEQVKKITKDQGVDYVVEVTGDPNVINPGIEMLRVGGKYILLGAIYPGSDFTVDSSKIIRNAIKIIGLHNYSPKYLKDAMNLVKQSKNKYPFKKLVGPNFDFSVQGVENAFKSLDSKKSLRPSIIPS